jgi:hypothetical protein
MNGIDSIYNLAPDLFVLLVLREFPDVGVCLQPPNILPLTQNVKEIDTRATQTEVISPQISAE